MEEKIPPFTMPMYREFIPKGVRPWIYLLQAFCFQLSGCVYLGALNEMIGGMSLMREDITMCLYSNLAGMAIWFPVLFRMKFHFPNRSLLMSAALVIAICNLLFTHTTFLPLMWGLCFVAGIAKIQGTFECMSNIQLWMTPKRNFAVFFPILHIVLLTSIQLQEWYSAWFAQHLCWQASHWFVATLMMLVVGLQFFLTRPWCPLPQPAPLKGIDWTGAFLWSLFGLQIAYIFNYGDWLDWWHSPTVRLLTGTALITLFFALQRMRHRPGAFCEPDMWGYRHLFPIVLLIALVEGILAAEHVLEEVYYEEVMEWEMLTSRELILWSLPGIWLGCGLSLLWLRVWKFNVYKLIAIGLLGITLYCTGEYFTVAQHINIEALRWSIACRGFGYAVLSISFMWCLHEIMSFEHFFQALSVFNVMHMYIGGVIGCAIYAWGIRYYMADNIVRYAQYLTPETFSATPLDIGTWMEDFVPRMMAVSIKQLYGWALYISAFLTLGFLLWDIPTIRRHARRFPGWPITGVRAMVHWANLARQRAEKIK